MSIRYDSRNKRWRFEFDRHIEGRRQRASRLLPKGWTQAQAHAFDLKESARLHALASGIDRPEPLIEDAVLLYLKHHAPTLKTEENLRRELELCFDIYRGKTFAQLPEVARDYKPTRADGTPLAPASVRNRIAYLRAACRYAWKYHGMGESDPAQKVAMPRVRNERQTYIDRGQMLAIARLVRHRATRMAIRIAFYSGMRLSEILRAVPTRQGWLLHDTKNDQPRIVPIHPRVAVCARHFVACPKITIQSAWQRARDAAGRHDVRFHDLRHSTASALINAGTDLYTVGAVLGHKDSRSTARYSHLSTESLTAAVLRIGQKSPHTTQKKRA